MSPSDDRRASSDRATSQRPDLPKELRDGDSWGREVLEKLPVPVAIVRRADGKILFTNPCLEDLVGRPAKRLWNKNCDVLFPNIRDRRRICDTLSKNGCVRGELLQVRRRDATMLWVALWQRPAVCNGIECVISTFIDITDQKLGEAEQEKKLASLKRLVDVSDHQWDLIAYEIHDGFVQEMVTALMHLDACRWVLGGANDKAIEQLDLVTNALRDGVQEARRLIERCQPPNLTAAGLVGALRQLSEKVSGHSKIRIDFGTDMSFPRLSEEAEVAVYRMVQECLNNVCRHSQSTEARVRLLDCGDHVEIEVQDWGVGFNPDMVGDKHYGLAGLRHRARLLKGQTEIHSQPNQGTRVSIRLPLEAQHSRDKREVSP
jgi:PAS domain S-box-containing protein